MAHAGVNTKPDNAGVAYISTETSSTYRNTHIRIIGIVQDLVIPFGKHLLRQELSSLIESVRLYIINADTRKPLQLFNCLTTERSICKPMLAYQLSPGYMPRYLRREADRRK